MRQNDAFYFERAISAAEAALARGDDGFASVLVGPDGEILLERGNEAGASSRNPLRHDTIILIDEAVRRFDRDFLGKCTVYAVMEPCAMCMGAAFWAGIRHIKFAMPESGLNAILPGGLEIHSGEFAARCPVPMDVQGPFPAFTGAYEVVERWVRKLTGGTADETE